MTHILGHDRAQLLLPEVVDDYVGADNPVRKHAVRNAGRLLWWLGLGRGSSGSSLVGDDLAQVIES